MIVQHNMTAENTKRNTGIITKQGRFSTERLSSGYRINHAADDASGLSVSEGMRAQIRGLDRASLNCDDGNSLVSVADGAMQEVSSVLNRIRELCVQAANDTNTSSDREALSMEIDALTDEVDRIGKETEFNTLKILQGGAPVTQKITTVTYQTHPGVTNGFNNQVQCNTKYPMSTPYTDPNGNTFQGSYTLDFGWINSAADWDSLDGAGFTFCCTLGCKQEFSFTFDKNIAGGTIIDETPNASVHQSGIQNNKVFTVGTAGYTSGEDFINDLQDFVKTLSPAGNKVGHDNKIATTTGKDLVVYGTNPGSSSNGYLIVGRTIVTTEDVPIPGRFYEIQLDIQTGSNAGQLTRLYIPRIDSQALGMDRLDISNNQSAGNSILCVDEMMDILNSHRASMGAFSNRMNHASDTNKNTAENLQTSESDIRDADMAKEMVDFSRVNILKSAGQSIMTQANSSLTGTMQLLK